VTSEGSATTLNVKSPAGDLARTVELPAEVFDVQVNVPLIHQVVVAQLAAARQGTHDTKTRGEVSGGGRKPYRQKGTGRARQGSIRAPQFAGGGVVHGPTPRDYAQRTPKKMKAAALRGALSDRARNERVHVVADLVTGDAPSTKTAVAALAGLSDRRHLLVVVERSDDLTWKSLRNVPRVHLIAPDQLNTYDVLVADDVVFTEGAFAAFLAGPATGRSATAVARESEVAAETETAEPVQAEATKDKPAAAQPAAAEPAAAEPATAEATAAEPTADEVVADAGGLTEVVASAPAEELPSTEGATTEGGEQK
jgi:large subunit ribosomal protein L4